MRSSPVVVGACLLLAIFARTSAEVPRPGLTLTEGPAQTAAQAPGAATQPQQQGAGISGNVEHGRYLVEKVAMCVECHSPRDAQGNIIDSRRYLGAPVPFRPPWPNDWAIWAPRNKGLTGYEDEPPAAERQFERMRILAGRRRDAGRVDRSFLHGPLPHFATRTRARIQSTVVWTTSAGSFGQSQ